MSIKRTLAALCLLLTSIAHADVQTDHKAYVDIASEYSKLLGKAERAHDPAILNSPQGTALAEALSDDKRFLSTCLRSPHDQSQKCQGNELQAGVELSFAVFP